MTKSEALNLAAQLGLTLARKSTVDDLVAQVRARGLLLAVDNVTGAWVVLNGDVVVAECA